MPAALLQTLGLIVLAGLGGLLVWRWWQASRAVSGPLPHLIALLRLAALALLLAAWLNPALPGLGRRAARPEVTLLVDASASMGLPEAEGLTRWEAVQRQLAAPAVAELLGRLTVRRTACAASLLAQPLPPAPAGETTDLALAIQQLRATIQPGTPVVLLSDGLQTHGDAVAAARQFAVGGARVHTVGVGPGQPPPDTALVTVQAPRVVCENQPIPAVVVAVGHSRSQRASLRFSRDGRVARDLPLNLPAGRQVSARTSLPGLPAGTYLFTAELPPTGPEATLTNNRRSFLVEVRRDKTRLAIVAGAPAPEYAALRRVLTALPRTELEAWVQTAPGQFLRQTGDTSRPGELNWDALLKGRHVLLLANLEASAIPAATVQRFVNQGGALGGLGGPRAAQGNGYGRGPWAGMLPAAPGAYTETPVGVAVPLAATPLGQTLAQAAPGAWWTSAPYLTGTQAASALRSAATVVWRSRQGRPLLVTGDYGLGRALTLLTDATANWQLSAGADDQSRRLHEAFWTGLAGWLATPRDQGQVVLMLDPPVAALGQPVRALVQVSRGLEPVANATVSVQVRPAAGQEPVTATPTAYPGRYQAPLSGLAPGTYEVTARAQAGTARQELVVEPGGAEVSQLTRQEGVLREVAAAGKGTYRDLSQLPQLLAELAQGPSGELPRPLTRPFRSGAVAGLILALLVTEWFLRRRYAL